jgi:hypothetical protein
VRCDIKGENELGDSEIRLGEHVIARLLLVIGFKLELPRPLL